MADGRRPRAADGHPPDRRPGRRQPRLLQLLDQVLVTRIGPGRPRHKPDRVVAADATVNELGGLSLDPPSEIVAGSGS
jgi:hypothetical protein